MNHQSAQHNGDNMGYFVVTQTVHVYSMLRPLFALAQVSVAGAPLGSLVTSITRCSADSATRQIASQAINVV